MRALISFFTRTWVLVLLGVVALSLVVWIAGPLVSFNGHVPLEGVMARLYAILFLFVCMGLWLAWRAWRAHRANAELLRNMEAAPAAPPSDREVAAAEGAQEVERLSKRFQEALAVLKKARLGGRFGQQYLYQLPWYMIIGAPGAGKTTALVNSGLRFPLSESFGSGAVAGVGGTRDCDWWFTDEAVLLDTAGRYATQDSRREVDSAAWKGFLNLLKTQRKRRPVNGVLLTVSVQDLLQQDASARAADAAQLRARIQEVYSELGVRCPIYVLVTKSDMLAGFTEFFDTLSEGERAQVWGFTYPVEPAADKDAGDMMRGFAAEFDLLESRLNGRLVERLQQERDPGRRALIYGFPQQVSAFRPLLQGFLAEIFTATRYEQKPWVRGVYFTSGTQEGSPIDRVIGALASSFGLRRQAPPLVAGRGRSYFLTQMMQDVVFNEAGLAGANPKVERRRKWLQRAAYALSAVVLVLAVLLFTVSYGRNRAYVADVEEHTQAAAQLAAGLAPQQTAATDALPLLDALRTIPAGYAERDKGTPWLMGFGLYQGDMLGGEAQDDYHRLLNEALLPRIKARLEAQLRAAAGTNPDLLYEGLRVYLMLHDRAHFDADSVLAWLNFDLDHNLVRQATQDQRASLSTHFQALVDRDSLDFAQPLDDEVVNEARRNLQRVPPAQRAYSRLVREFARGKLTEFTVVSPDGGGANAPIVLARRSGELLTRGVPGLFTVAGYRQFVPKTATAAADLTKDAWVLGQAETAADSGASDRLVQDVMQLYYLDYIHRWDDFLADITLVSFSSPEQGARILGLLSGPDSPLRKLMQGASRETHLADAKPGKSLADQVKGKVESITNRLENALGGEATAPVAGLSTTPVDEHFQNLHRWVDGNGTPGSAPLDQSILVLGSAKAYLDAAAAAKQAGQPPPPMPAELNNPCSAGCPPLLAAVMKEASSSTSASTLQGERPRLNALWMANVAPLCQQAINNRYPIFARATEEVPQEDFGRIFAPGGLLDDFFQKNLAPYVDSSGPRWRWRPVGNVSLGIPDEVLVDLQRAGTIRDAFFRGGHSPSVRFDLKPLSFDKGLTQFTLDVDGQNITVTPTSQAKPVTFQWPGNGGGTSSTVRVEYQPATASGSGFTLQGPWALLRLMDRGNLTRTPQRERFNMNFDFDGHKVALELTASSVLNPFMLDALSQFRCPPRL